MIVTPATESVAVTPAIESMISSLYVANKNQIYLAGSATKDPDFAIKWREEAEARLTNFRCLSPFRGKKLDTTGKWQKYEQNEIVMRDLKDILSSDLVLAEMVFPDYNYIGTSMEIRTAADAGIPVVVWTEHWANHYWIRYHSVKCLPTLDACIEYINDYWSE